VDHEHELAIIRRAYAKQVLAWVRESDARLEEAFAAVPREAFLGPGPWPSCTMRMESCGYSRARASASSVEPLNQVSNSSSRVSSTGMRSLS
jgi:protein-L-isoaspartate O-methyltransferase